MNKSTLQRARLNKGLSQSQLAKATNIRLRTIQMYESGGRSIDGAGIDKLVKFAQILECPITELLENEQLKEECKKVQL